MAYQGLAERILAALKDRSGRPGNGFTVIGTITLTGVSGSASGLSRATVLLVYPAAPPPPQAPASPSRLPWAPMWAAGVLELGAAVLGSLPWQRPAWSPSMTRLIADVPVELWMVVVGMAVLCTAVAVVLSRRSTRLSARHVISWAWLGLVLLAAAALAWNAVYAAALSTIDFGAPIPIFDWLFTFAPAGLAGLLFSGFDRRVCRSAALGTGVVTVPLFALSWALLTPPDLSVSGVLSTLAPTIVLGVGPLAGGVALAGVFGAAPRPT